jgi:hypothetical protein
MPRQNRRRDPAPLRGIGGSAPRRESWQGVDHLVRSVPGASATKTYRCPGCAQLVPVGTPHVVAWPDDVSVGGGAEERRHWHTACWAARDRRPPR